MEKYFEFKYWSEIIAGGIFLLIIVGSLIGMIIELIKYNRKSKIYRSCKIKRRYGQGCFNDTLCSKHCSVYVKKENLKSKKSKKESK